MYFVSYRDPNVSKTLDVYNKSHEFVRDFEADENEMTKFIIGTMSELDIPLTPRSKGERSFIAYLIGIDYDKLQKERDEILSATAEDIKKLSKCLEVFLKDEAICVVGNEEAINKDKDLFKEVLPLIKK